MVSNLRTWKLFPLAIVALFVFKVRTTVAADGFLFTMPKVLRHGELSEFCMIVYGPEGNTRSITMSMIDRSDPKIKVLVENNYTSGDLKCNNFTVPRAGDYEMLLYNATAILHDSVEVNVEDHNLITLVQSDKPMYKPGQKVKFRILTFKSDQKPRTGQIAAIYIKNPSETRVKQFLNVDSQGIASLDFQLAAEAQRGKWSILVFLNDSMADRPDGTGTFEVKEYVLPRFEVKIIPPSFILADDDFVDVKVCATYTYGKPVDGYLDLKTCWNTYMGNNPCFHQVVSFSGCHNVSVNVTEMQGPEFYPMFGIDLKTTASVTEIGTGAIVNATQTGPTISTQPLKIVLEDYTNGFFKPNLPFYGKVIVTKPDGTPAPGENIRITAADYKNDLNFKANFTSDESGIIVYSLCGAFDERTPKINIDAVAYDYEQDSGESHRGMYTPRKYQEIKQWFSPSLSYIDIPKTETKHTCGDSLTLSIRFTTRAETNTDFKYQVMALGKIIRSGHLFYNHSIIYPGGNLLQPPPSICLEKDDSVIAPPIPDTSVPIPSEERPPTPPPQFNEPGIPVEGELFETKSLTPRLGGDIPPFDGGFEEPVIRSEKLSDTASNILLDIPILTNMAPKFTLLVYHTLPDGEVVADSMEFYVEPCFDNEVKMSFNETKALPGQNVNIHLEASPGSICGLGIVDKSVNILGGKHQITSDTVFKILERYNSPTWFDPFHTDEAYCEERIKKMIVGESKESEGAFWHYNSPYVDAMQAFMSSGFITLTDLNLQTRPCSRSYPVFYGSVPMALGSMQNSIPGAMGPVPLTTDRQTQGSSSGKIRDNFPETWLWDLQIIGVNGSEDFVEETPDTITSWVGNAVCMDAENGVGVSSLESLTTFQPFFIHLHLPYSAVRGERLPLMINVFNYLEKCLKVQLTLDVEDNLEVHNAVDIRKPLCVCGGKSVTTKLYVTPLNIGSLPVTLTAEVVPGLCENKVDVDLTYIGLTDAVQRKLFVKAEGVMSEYTHTSYMCPKGDRESVENLILPIPEAIVKDSERGEVKIIGDIMGPALTNLDNLVRLPTGCGEQNMVGFTPNIFVLKYLTNTGRLTEKIQTDAKKYMEIGYQRELKYRHSDGAYSAFGEKDVNGSVWLTAFVVKSFAQARPFVYIDELDLEISVTYLRRKQLENGCFRETGKVFSSHMMGGLGRKKSSYIPLTAYVLIALLKADVNASERVIVSGFNCLNREYRREKNKIGSYSLALLAYAHTLYNSESRTCRDVMRVLNSKARREGSLKYWKRDGPKPATPSFMYYHSAPPAEVEMTSYALLAYLEFYGSRAVPHTHKIALWLSKQRNPHGGFASTQDTVVGLNALSEFALLSYSNEPTDLNVTVEGNDFGNEFHVSDEKNTVLLLQRVQIPTIPNSISIGAQGSGCVLVQANVQFNKPTKDFTTSKPGLHLKVQPSLYQHDIDRCDRRTLRISVGINRGSHKYSKGMSLVTVKMVTSWAPISDSLTKIQSLSPKLGLKRHEYDEEHGIVTFYLDELRKKPVEFSLDVEQDREMSVSGPKSAEVTVFQYYETDVSVVQSYNLKTICGTKAEIPRKRIELPGPFPQQVRVGGPPSRSFPNRIQVFACPICVESVSEVEDLESIYCNSTTVYKAVSGRGPNKQYTLKLKVDVKAPKESRNVNKFASYSLPPGCNCPLMEPPVRRVHIFTSNSLKQKNIFLDASSAVIKSSKQTEKLLRKLRKNCPGN